jgi:hypothetical protein
LPVDAHCAHVVNSGLPLHEGPVLKRCGGSGACAVYVPQQMRASPVQSLSEVQAFGHVFWQTPLQQSSPVDAQSLDVVHDCGHVSYIGLRQSPLAVTVGSIDLTEVQHTSPMLVWQSELVLHALGHSLPGTQIPWL